jgi:plastocyanin
MFTQALVRSGLRCATVVGLIVAMALPSVPATAQPPSVPAASTQADCAIQLSVANPTPGDQEVPRSLEMSGTAMDATATSGTGISQVQVFLGSRDLGGEFIGSTPIVGGATGVPGFWSITTNIPANVSGGQSLFVYGISSVSDQQAFVAIPVVVGESLTGISVSDTAQSFCPAIMPAATATPVAPVATPTSAPAATTPTPVPPTPVPAAPPAPVNPPVPAPPPAAAAVMLTISSPASPPLSFDTTMLSATAGSQVTVTYTNNEPGVPHDWHVFNGPDSSSPTLASTQIITGPGTTDSVTFTAPTQTGNYFFWCDVHPTIMTGTLVIN